MRMLVWATLGCATNRRPREVAGVEPASCYLKVAGSLPLVCMLTCPGQDTKPQTAPDVLVTTLHGSRHHQCMNACMNYCKSLWTKASDKCPECKFVTCLTCKSTQSYQSWISLQKLVSSFLRIIQSLMSHMCTCCTQTFMWMIEGVTADQESLWSYESSGNTFHSSAAHVCRQMWVLMSWYQTVECFALLKRI